MSVAPLWTSDAMAEAMRASRQRRVAGSGHRASPSTAARIAPGEAYFAIKGDVHDGHDFVEAALKAGAALAVVEGAQCDNSLPMRRYWWWMTCSAAWSILLVPRARVSMRR